MSSLNERIKELRKSKNHTQKQLAEILNVRSEAIQTFEYGTRRPGLDNIITLADYFGVSVDYLLGRTDNPNINK